MDKNAKQSVLQSFCADSVNAIKGSFLSLSVTTSYLYHEVLLLEKCKIILLTDMNDSRSLAGLVLVPYNRYPTSR